MRLKLKNITGLLLSTLYFVSVGSLGACIDPSKSAPIGSGMDFSQARVEGEYGEEVLIAELSDNNQQIILHFWASWCLPCLKELPELASAIGELKSNNFAVIPISTDYDDADLSRRTLNKLGLHDFPVNLDGHDLFRQFNLLGMPATVAFDARGKEIKRVLGAVNWRCQELATELSSFE